jgi:hypothetical protein
MIRRTPTAITVTSEDVKEARASIQAFRNAQNPSVAQEGNSHATAGRSNASDSSFLSNSMDGAVDYQDEQRRRREVQSRNERIGL